MYGRKCIYGNMHQNFMVFNGFYKLVSMGVIPKGWFINEYSPIDDKLLMIIFRGFQLVLYPKFAGWCISGKIPTKNGLMTVPP